MKVTFTDVCHIFNSLGYNINNVPNKIIEDAMYNLNNFDGDYGINGINIIENWFIGQNDQIYQAD